MAVVEYTLPYLDCLNIQLTPALFLISNKFDILFIMYFIISLNANKMRIHTDQLMMSKCMYVVYFWELAMAYWWLTPAYMESNG